MTPKRRALNLSVIFACLCFSKSLLIKSLDKAIYSIRPSRSYVGLCSIPSLEGHTPVIALEGTTLECSTESTSPKCC